MTMVLKLFLATRPAFLTITLLGCLIGLSIPSSRKESMAINLLAVTLTLCIHAGANLINDYFDHLNGSDENNRNRISPFTGGSRFIQNHLIKPIEIYQLGFALITLSVFIGLYICSQTTWLLIPLGFIGVTAAWTYSAPPLQLMSRGVLGELSIAIAWSLVVIGFAFMQTTNNAYQAIPIGLAYGLMASNILLINQIPDIEADRVAQKLTLAAKSSPHELRAWYTGISIAAYTLQIIGIYFFGIPIKTLITLSVIPVFIFCANQISEEMIRKNAMKKLILHNLVAIHLYSLLLLIGLLWR